MNTERTDDLLEPGEHTEQPQAEQPVVGPPLEPLPPPPPPAEGKGGCGLHMLRIAVGAGIAFVVMSLLYGPNMAMMAIAFAVVCTAGVSLILILPGCWLVGWVAIAAWEAISREFAKPPAPGAP